MNIPYRIDPFFKWTVIIIFIIMIATCFASCRIITGIEKTDYHGGKGWTDKAGNFYKKKMNKRKSFFH